MTGISGSISTGAPLDGYSGGEKFIDLNVLNKDKTLEDLIIR